MVGSMIKIFPNDSTDFTSNGLGWLKDVTEATVTEERNGLFEFKMKYPINGRRYNDIVLRNLIVTKPNPYASPQAFRIYEITKPLKGIVTVYAEHISYDLSGVPVKPFEADTVSDALNKIKQNSINQNPFTFWTNKTVNAVMNNKVITSARSLLGGVDGSVLDTYKGEYEFDNFTVKLHDHRGQNRGVSIRYGKNMTDLEHEENCSNVYTGLAPFWYSEEDGIVMLPEYYVPVEGTFAFSRILVVNFSSDFQEIPSPVQLRDRAKKYITENKINVPKTSLDLSFEILSQSEEYESIHTMEQVNLCDEVNVYFEELGVNGTAKCIKTIYNCLLERYDSIRLGDARTNLANTIHDNQNDNSEELKNAIDTTRSKLEQEIEHATKLITGGLGGYVVIQSSTGGDHPDEILIMDTPDIKTAKNVWRWNKNGLGFSSNGYDGPFRTAITYDGHIVADFITAGTLNGALVEAGTITADKLDIDYKLSVTEEINYATTILNQNIQTQINQVVQTWDETTDNLESKIYDDMAKEDLKTRQQLANTATSLEQTFNTAIKNTFNSISLRVDQIDKYMNVNYVKDGNFEEGFDTWMHGNLGGASGSVTIYRNQYAVLPSMTYLRQEWNDLNILSKGSYVISFEYMVSGNSQVSVTLNDQNGSNDVAWGGMVTNTHNNWETFELTVDLSVDLVSKNGRGPYFQLGNSGLERLQVRRVAVNGNYIEYANSQLLLLSDRITAEVTRANDVEGKLQAAINVQADKISLAVTKNNIGSFIEQYYNRVIIGFNNNSKYVQITAGTIDIYNNGVELSKLRSRFDERGIHFWRDGYYLGKIGTNNKSGYPEIRGLVMDLEYLGKYMSFAFKKRQADSVYTGMWTFSNDGGLYNEFGIHAGADLDMHYYKIKNFSLPSGYSGWSGTIPIVTRIWDSGDALNWETSTIVCEQGFVRSGPG